jgi:hypothetical protein
LADREINTVEDFGLAIRCLEAFGLEQIDHNHVPYVVPMRPQPPMRFRSPLLYLQVTIRQPPRR